MTGRWCLLLLCGLLGSWAVPVSIAAASETVTYSYDARGRLVQVTRSGSVNNGVQANYCYDRADNRTNVMVATTGGPGAVPSFSINDAAETEGSTLVFAVTKCGPAASSYSVSYATSAGSATAGSDYTTTSGTLTFAPTDTTKTISVPTTDDSAIEGGETLIVTLSAATGGSTISDATGTGTIRNNDYAPPSFSISDAVVDEGSYAAFIITKTGTTSSNYSINYATANGSAISGSDYVATSATVTFAPSEMSKTISVPSLEDGVAEGNETFSTNLSGATGGSSIGAGQGIGTIFNVAPFEPETPCYDAGGNPTPCP